MIKSLLEYKETCVDEKLWHILAQKLGGLLRKDYDERSEDDRLIIERILILVRNILEVNL
jgi:timeless